MSDDQDGCEWWMFLLVLAYLGSPGSKAVKWLSVRVCDLQWTYDVCGRPCTSRIGLFAHRKSHRWREDPSTSTTQSIVWLNQTIVIHNANHIKVALPTTNSRDHTSESDQSKKVQLQVTRTYSVSTVHILAVRLPNITDRRCDNCAHRLPERQLWTQNTLHTLAFIKYMEPI